MAVHSSSMKQFVIVGHVDDGKSTFAGHLLYLTGCIDEHTLNVTREEAERDGMGSWVWARLTDILDSERRRGKTQEINSIEFNHNDQKYCMIDTPGHETLIPVMVSSLYENNINVRDVIGVVMVSVSSFTKSFDRGSFKEDVLLLRASGITRLIIAINKMDVISWDMSQYNACVSSIRSFVKALRFKDVQFVPISALSGDNIVTRHQKDERCFMEILSSMTTEEETAVRHETQETRVLRGIIQAFNLSFLSAGSRAVLHTSSGVVTMVIDKLQPDILRSNERGRARIITSSPIRTFTSQSLIIRSSSNETLGYFVVHSIVTSK